MTQTGFFTRDRKFYRQLFYLMIVVTMQNLVAYSVNMADNLMLGNYGQTALSGAAVVNQIFFMVQQISSAVGDTLVILGAQYWGQKRPEPVRSLVGIALKASLGLGIVILLAVSAAPEAILGLFTTDPAIVAEGVSYLAIIRYTFVLFMISNVLMAALRCVGTVNISFVTSLVSLLVNAGINYCLIYGRFGLPEMGIRGAAIGTLAARILELAIVLWYLVFRDRKLQLFAEGFPGPDRQLAADYIRVGSPVLLAQLIWGIAVPIQTAIMGHMSSDAIAANSVATTFYQYLKVVAVAMSSATAVMIGNVVGKGDRERIRSDARTIEVLDLGIGLALGILLFALRGPLLQFYNISEGASVLAGQMLAVLSVAMVGMAYQMPVSTGIIRGGGDTRFCMILNIISTWGIVMPLSFLSAFRWNWPVIAVVMVLQSDQVFKCVPVFFRMRSYKWIRNLTREKEGAPVTGKET